MNTTAKPLPPRQTPSDELPQFLSKPQPLPPRPRVQQVASTVENDDDIYTPFSIKMTEYLWPTVFWFLAVYNAVVMVLASFSIFTAGYDVWVHAQAGVVTVSTMAVAAMIVKWILNGPDGLPLRRRPPILPALDKSDS